MFTHGSGDPDELRNVLHEKSRVEEEIRTIQHHLSRTEEHLKTCRPSTVEYQQSVEDLLALQASLAELSAHVGFLAELTSCWRREQEHPPADLA
jgi:hypothetical protein